MIKFEELIKMHPDEILMLSRLEPIAKRAKNYAALIQKTYLFHAGEESIIISDDNVNREYFTYTGVWQARYLHQNYDVVCDAENIFKIMAAACLIQEGLIPQYDSNCRPTPEYELHLVYGHFSGFLQHTLELYNHEHPREKVVIL